MNKLPLIAAMAFGLNTGVDMDIYNTALYSPKTVFSKPKMSTKKGSYGARKRRKTRKAQKAARKNNRKS